MRNRDIAIDNLTNVTEKIITTSEMKVNSKIFNNRPRVSIT